jgi:hypothetical protein
MEPQTVCMASIAGMREFVHKLRKTATNHVFVALRRIDFQQFATMFPATI